MEDETLKLEISKIDVIAWTVIGLMIIGVILGCLIYKYNFFRG